MFITISCILLLSNKDNLIIYINFDTYMVAIIVPYNLTLHQNGSIINLTILGSKVLVKDDINQMYLFNFPCFTVYNARQQRASGFTYYSRAKTRFYFKIYRLNTAYFQLCYCKVVMLMPTSGVKLFIFFRIIKKRCTIMHIFKNKNSLHQKKE